MSFTDQKSWVVTEEDCSAQWGGYKNGEKFRCHLCGHKFKVGDIARWVIGHKTINFFVCSSCDNGDVRSKFLNAIEESKVKFWWLWLE